MATGTRSTLEVEKTLGAIDGFTNTAKSNLVAAEGDEPREIATRNHIETLNTDWWEAFNTAAS